MPTFVGALSEEPLIPPAMVPPLLNGITCPLVCQHTSTVTPKNALLSHMDLLLMIQVAVNPSISHI